MSGLYGCAATAVACRSVLAGLREGGEVSPEGEQAAAQFVERVVERVAAQTGHTDCVVQADILHYRCLGDTWSFLLSRVRVCSAVGEPIAELDPRAQVRLVASVGRRTEAPPLQGCCRGQVFSPTLLLLAKYLDEHRLLRHPNLTPHVADLVTQAYAALCGGGAAVTVAPGTLLPEEAAPSAESSSSSVDQYVVPTAVGMWMVGTFCTPPRKISSRMSDKRNGVLTHAVLFDGGREVSLSNVRLELEVS